MAQRRNIFRTAFMKAGKLLGAWRGWTADWRRMCYLWEHLEGRNGISVGWDADGSCYIDGREVGGGGGGGASGTVSFVGAVKYDVSYHVLQQRIDTLDLATGQVTQGTFSTITGGQAVPLSGG